MRPGGRRGVLTAAATACTVAALVILSVTLVSTSQPPPVPPETGRGDRTAPRDTSAPYAPGLPHSRPVSVKIPGIGLTAKVEGVGLTADRSVALPADPDHVGWYTGSVTPGESGNTVVVGHLDSATGPAALYAAGALRPGDRISLQRRDGTTVTFTVTDLNVWAKDHFPSRRVYAPTTEARLTVITCAGWDDDADTYTSNLVITAQREPQDGAPARNQGEPLV
ncbi:sortase [Streptomyces sp. H27-C3]|uniref:sortase domain-containing protein n=1 Tax=Streptomyces sp. H27-C3 TaxID=3046305 RepID=UPI0024BAFF2F|nr:sortase [Streptomyces sp. H27-C3]MDJ0464291.1 sortase [Streptomyces sp. H27-C3]